MRPALSTSFLGNRDVTWERLKESFRTIGASEVELSYNLGPEAARDVLTALPGSGLRVVSAHHPFPFPRMGPQEDPYADVFNPLAPLESERRAARELVKESLRAASRAGAGALVVHLGSIPELEDLERELWRRFKAKKDVTSFTSKYLRKRQKYSKTYVERALRVLGDLLPLAEDLRIALGLENRFFLMSFPSLEEFRLLFETFDSSSLGYWHDVGHGVVRARFGYEEMAEVAMSLRDRLVGMHVHDAVGVKDHRAPGDGEVDFFEIFRLFGVPERVVFEPAPNMELEKVKRGFEHMEGIFEKLEKK